MRPALPPSAYTVRKTPARGIDARLGLAPEAQLAEGEAAEHRGDYVVATTAYTAAAASDEPCVGAEARFRLGRVAWRQGRFDDALALYERSRSMAEECGATECRAAAEVGIGTIHCERAEYARARASYQVAFGLTESASLKAKIHLNLGVIAAMEHDVPQARELYGRAVQGFQSAADDAGLALALHNLGMLHASLGEWVEAEEAYGRCLGVCERMGNKQMLAAVMLKRVELLADRERLDEAAAECERVLVVLGDLGDEVGRAEAFRWQGYAYRRLGRREAADVRLRDAARIAARLQVPLLEAHVSEELGLMRVDDGDTRDALSWLERAHSRFQAVNATADAERVAARLESLGRAPRRISARRRAIH